MGCFLDPSLFDERFSTSPTCSRSSGSGRRNEQGPVGRLASARWCAAVMTGIVITRARAVVKPTVLLLGVSRLAGLSPILQDGVLRCKRRSTRRAWPCDGRSETPVAVRSPAAAGNDQAATPTQAQASCSPTSVIELYRHAGQKPAAAWCQ